MFSKIFSRGKGIFTRKILPIFFGFCFVMGMALFSGCSMGNDGPGLLEGAWRDSIPGDSYIITNGTVTYDDGGDYGQYSMDMAGTIASHSNFSASAGIIYVKYAEPPSLAGKYIALYWKELTESNVYLSIAINSDYSNPAVDTFAEATQKFTLENADTNWVFQWGGPYAKQ